MMGLRKNSTQKKMGTSPQNKDVTLIMECETEPLSEAQLEYKNKIEEEYNKFMKKLEEGIAKRGGEIIEQGSHITVYEIDCSPNFPPPLGHDITVAATPSPGLIKPTPTSSLLATTQAGVPPPLVPNSGVLLQSGAVPSSSSPVFSGQPTTYQLVMGPRMGLIVTPSTPAPSSTVQSATNVSVSAPGLTPTRLLNAPRVQVRANLGTVIPPPTKRLVNVTAPPKISVNPVTQKNTPPVSKISTPIPPLSTVNTRSKVKLATRTSENPPEPIRSTPSPKTTSTPAAVVDLTDDDGKPIADSREVSFNKYQNRIYPSLVVVARPNLKVKDMTSAMITAERTQLDTKVKGILTNSPTKFTEWLIQQGLVRSEQVCTSHVSVDMTPIKLKLGMYSDVTKFPYSGGYVWISDCCPQKFVSVFCNSIFEGAPHAPTVLLKLIYHWACQTNVHNIISWVKVDNLYIKNFFTNLRAICTAAICEKFGKMGGVGKKIEVGVISLGTTSQNGSVRQVKVEVLGVMDPVTKYVRLRAVDPVQNAEKNHKLRFSRILESLEQWVDKRTTIVTDFTVDKGTLNDLGFHSVHQVQLNSTQSKDNNQAVMEYLKRVVPRMFQNTLSLLSRSIIQQFLDELVWRERWGPISSRAFDNLILHLSEMTKLDTGDTLINRLKNITANPFKDWSFKNWKTNSTSIAGSKKTSVMEDIDTHVKGLTQKNMALRSKPGGASGVSKTTSSAAKNSRSGSVSMMNLDDTVNDIPIVPSIDNLPPSITEIDDDNVSVSSSSSRRSRTRASANEGATGVGSNRLWDPQLVLKSLESFYYGTLPSDIVVINKLRQVELNMKCFTCGHTYNNNILFMKHLAGHAQNEGAFTTDYQCRYCLKNFTTDFDLEDHLGSVHFPNKFNSMCLICGDRFKYRGALVTHMQTTHVELELPYQCTICKFRASEHTKLVDHFYEVHNGGEKVQCPFCLKVVAFESSNKIKLTQNVNFYFNHIKRHQKKPIRKCPKCVLQFVNKALLKEHLIKDHNSCLNIPGIIRHQGSDLSTVLMPLPSVAPPLTRKGKPAQSFPVPNFSTYKLDNVLVYPDVPPSQCVECKTDVIPSNHFTSYMTCMKCMFASCCKVVMSKHVDKMHEVKGKRKNTVKRKIPLEKPLFCICGFSSADGNAIASHLVHCKRRSAYPNSERAAQCSVQMQSASFPPLVNLDDVEQDSNDASNKWLRAFVKQPENDESKSKKTPISEKSPPRMLKMLGLVCKESSGVEEDGVSPDKVKLPEKDDDSAPSKNNDPKSAEKDQRNKTKADDKAQIDDEIMELSDDDSNVGEKSTSDGIVYDVPDDKSNDNNETVKEKSIDKNGNDNADEVLAAVGVLEKTNEGTTEIKDRVENENIIESISLLDTSLETEASEKNKNSNDDVMDLAERSPSVEKMDEQDENATAMECEDNSDESNKMAVDTESSLDVMVVD